MARTWTLDTTLTNSVKAPNFVTGGDRLYFIATDNQTVLSWDGTTEADISGATWSGDDVVRDLCYFGSTIYAAVDTYDGVGGYGCGVYSYDGAGTSWTLEETLQIGGNDCQFNTGDNEDKWLVADGDRMVVVASDGFGNTRLWATTDGSTYTEQTINSGTTYKPNENLLGTLFTELTEITFIAQAAGVRRAVQYDTGVNWAFIGADIGSNGPILAGYADSVSFFATYTDTDLDYSSDWGVNRTATSLTASSAGANEGQPRVYYLADNAIMTLDDSGDPTAFVWDSSSNDFVADGDTGTDDIVGFFAINGILYAICTNKIYSGGELTPDPYALTYSAGAVPGYILEEAA